MAKDFMALPVPPTLSALTLTTEPVKENQGKTSNGAIAMARRPVPFPGISAPVYNTSAPISRTKKMVPALSALVFVSALMVSSSEAGITGCVQLVQIPPVLIIILTAPVTDIVVPISGCLAPIHTASFPDATPLSTYATPLQEFSSSVTLPMIPFPGIPLQPTGKSAIGPPGP